MEENKTQMNKDNMDIHSMLVQTYDQGTVPQKVNVRLMNQLKYKEQTQEKGISFWWLPAFINTCIMGGVCVISILLFLILKYISADWIMPNLTQAVSKFAVWIVCGCAMLQVAISWLFTLISMWKLNLKNKCRIFNG